MNRILFDLPGQNLWSHSFSAYIFCIKKIPEKSGIFLRTGMSTIFCFQSSVFRSASVFSAARLSSGRIPVFPAILTASRLPLMQKEGGDRHRSSIKHKPDSLCSSSNIPSPCAENRSKHPGRRCPVPFQAYRCCPPGSGNGPPPPGLPGAGHSLIRVYTGRHQEAGAGTVWSL